MAIDLRTVINNDVDVDDSGNVKEVQSGMTTITQDDQSIIISPVSTTQKAYLIVTFRADSVYTPQGFVANFINVSTFNFSAGGATGTLSWQVVEVF